MIARIDTSLLTYCLPTIPTLFLSACLLGCLWYVSALELPGVLILPERIPTTTFQYEHQQKYRCVTQARCYYPCLSSQFTLFLISGKPLNLSLSLLPLTS
ncbi:hypothetical protein B0T17DRAFT_524257 [Bombardia bombarda]|uniref:Uncharacterized protein n=1 Tax=Bombardia bombarda TaxID=252184 RepID=A0AA40C8K0_9PEZI|nr:hypothetical protein B0T17DRAFT_524257 [Bombardia bombarda]